MTDVSNLHRSLDGVEDSSKTRVRKLSKICNALLAQTSKLCKNLSASLLLLAINIRFIKKYKFSVFKGNVSLLG